MSYYDEEDFYESSEFDEKMNELRKRSFDKIVDMVVEKKTNDKAVE